MVGSNGGDRQTAAIGLDGNSTRRYGAPPMNPAYLQDVIWLATLMCGVHGEVRPIGW